MSDSKQPHPIDLNKRSEVKSVSGHVSTVPEQSEVSVTHYKVEFTGKTAEYFRIWMVNLALTIVTFGFYTPWARVRTRQYFYGHTWLDNHNFEYTANPLILLRGYILVTFFALLYGIAPEIQFEGWEFVSFGVLALFIVLFPWLVRQSMKFNAKNTVHRGLNFRFHGKTSEAYISYGLANIIAGLSGYLGMPWAWFMQRRYQIDNISFGKAKGRFRGDMGEFYKIGFIGVGIAIVSFVTMLILVMMIGIISGISLNLGNLDEISNYGAGMAMMALIILAYFMFLLITVVVWQYIRAATMKYVLENIEIGGVVRLGTTLSVTKVIKIGIVNAIATLLSLGLLSPWAHIRMTRYILSNIQVRTITDLESFQADVSKDESVLGEVATDVLDIDVGF